MNGVGAHRACISCDVCQQLLSIPDSASSMKEDINELFCVNCQTFLKLSHCQYCKEAVEVNDKTNIVNGRFTWHQRCLRCSQCSKSLSEGDQFTVFDITGKVSRATKPKVENASAICRECFINKHEDKCEICFKVYFYDFIIVVY